MSCIYQGILHCPKCIHPLHRECHDFVKAHTAWCVRVLQPFSFQRQSFGSPVVWSTDMNKAKSAALQYVLKNPSEVKKYSISQVVSMVLDGEEITHRIIYVEATSKPMGDPEKIVSVLKSFIEKVQANNGFVSLFLSNISNIKLPEYPRL